MAEKEILEPMLSELLTIETEHGTEFVDTPEKWERKRSQIQENVINIIGEFPSERPPLDVEILDEVELEGYVRRKVSYAVESDERVSAYLLLPQPLTNTEGVPAVLCLHGTSREAKDGQVGLSDRKDTAHALHLAQRGYVTLAPDHLCSGERIAPGLEPYDTASFYQRHPEWSAVGKAIWDAQRAIDYLVSLDYVAPLKWLMRLKM